MINTINIINIMKLKGNYKLVLLGLIGISFFALFDQIIFGDYFHTEHKIKNCTILEYDTNFDKTCDFIKKNNIQCEKCKFNESNFAYIECDKRIHRAYAYKDYINYKKYNSYNCDSNKEDYKLNKIYRVGINIHNDMRLNYFYDDDLAIQNRTSNINSIISLGILFSILIVIYVFMEYKGFNKRRIYFMQKKFDLPIYHINEKKL